MFSAAKSNAMIFAAKLICHYLPNIPTIKIYRNLMQCFRSEIQCNEVCRELDLPPLTEHTNKTNIKKHVRIWMGYPAQSLPLRGGKPVPKKNTQTHRHTDTETPKHRAHRRTDTYTHRQTDARTQGHTEPHRHTDTPTHRHTGTPTQIHRDTETQRHRDTQTQIHRDTAGQRQRH